MASLSALKWHILVVFGIKVPVFLYDFAWQVVETKVVGSFAGTVSAENIFLLLFLPCKHPVGDPLSGLVRICAVGGLRQKGIEKWVRGQRHPSAAEADVDFAGFTRGLRPPPPSGSGFSARYQILPFQRHCFLCVEGENDWGIFSSLALPTEREMQGVPSALCGVPPLPPRYLGVND